MNGMSSYGARNVYGIPTDPAKRNQYVRNSLGKSMMPRSDLASREEVLALSRRMKGMNAGPMSPQPGAAPQNAPRFNTSTSSMGQDRQSLAASIINNDLRESMDNIRVLAGRIEHRMEDVYIGVNTRNKDRAFKAISIVQNIARDVVSMIEAVIPQMTFIDNAEYLDSLKNRSIEIEMEISQLFDAMSKARNSQNSYPEDIFEQINKIKSSARSMFSTWHRAVQEYETSVYNSIPLASSGGYRKRRTHRNRNRKHKRTHRNRKHKRTQRK